ARADQRGDPPGPAMAQQPGSDEEAKGAEVDRQAAPSEATGDVEQGERADQVGPGGGRPERSTLIAHRSPPSPQDETADRRLCTTSPGPIAPPGDGPPCATPDRKRRTEWSTRRTLPICRPTTRRPRVRAQ